MISDICCCSFQISYLTFIDSYCCLAFSWGSDLVFSRWGWPKMSGWWVLLMQSWGVSGSYCWRCFWRLGMPLVVCFLSVFRDEVFSYPLSLVQNWTRPATVGDSIRNSDTYSDESSFASPASILALFGVFKLISPLPRPSYPHYLLVSGLLTWNIVYFGFLLFFLWRLLRYYSLSVIWSAYRWWSPSFYYWFLNELLYEC